MSGDVETDLELAVMHARLHELVAGDLLAEVPPEEELLARIFPGAGPPP